MFCLFFNLFCFSNRHVPSPSSKLNMKMKNPTATPVFDTPGASHIWLQTNVYSRLEVFFCKGCCKNSNDVALPKFVFTRGSSLEMSKRTYHAANVTVTVIIYLMVAIFMLKHLIFFLRKIPGRT